MESPVPFTVDSSSHEVNNLFKLILDNLHEGVYFTDLERRITYWNKGAEALTGFSAQEVVGKRCADKILMHVNESGHMLCEGVCPLSRTLADGRAHEAEVYFHHKSGARVPAEVRVSPIWAKTVKLSGRSKSSMTTHGKGPCAKKLWSSRSWHLWIQLRK